jgi:hypothetical protein
VLHEAIVTQLAKGPDGVPTDTERAARSERIMNRLPPGRLDILCSIPGRTTV